MSDIVERLRTKHVVFDIAGKDISIEAADKIESLRQRVKELEEIGEELAALKQQGEPVAWVFSRIEPDYRGWITARSEKSGDYNTPLYTAPTIPEGWLKICTDELTRSTLTSNPLKFEFAKKHGLSGLDDVHMWMHTAHSVFKKMVETAAAPKPEDVK